MRRSSVSRLGLLQDAVLVAVSTLFLYVHVSLVADGHFTSVPFAVEQAILVGLFLFRRRSTATSSRPMDWVVAAGGWLPLLGRPDEGPAMAEGIGVAMQLTGLALSCVGFLYLGRSFGVVAANRGLKINGPYRIVRHPVYASHLITTFGFLLANPTPLNAAIIFGTAAFQLMRIRAEERVLSDTANYAEYRARVRWRLVPGVY